MNSGRNIVIVILLITTGAAALVAGVLAFNRPSGHQPGSDSTASRVGLEQYEGLEVPPFVLTRQDGQEVTRQMLEGRYTVMSFMFSHCVLVCPIMSGNLVVLQSKIADLPKDDVQFVSVSVDPAHDTPERLSEYASDLSADPERWSFLTGEMGTVRAIVEDGLHFSLGEEPDNPIVLPDGSTMANINHTGRLILLDPQVRVIGLYDSQREEEIDALAHDLRRLVNEG